MRVAVGDNQCKNFITSYDMDSNDINVEASSTYDALHRNPSIVRNMQRCREFTESDELYQRPGVVLNEQGFPHHERV